MKTARKAAAVAGGKKMVDLFTPLSGPETWRFRHGTSTVEVEAKTWYEARRKAAAVLGAAREDITMIWSPCVPRSSIRGVRS